MAGTVVEYHPDSSTLKMLNESEDRSQTGRSCWTKFQCKCCAVIIVLVIVCIAAFVTAVVNAKHTGNVGGMAEHQTHPGDNHGPALLKIKPETVDKYKHLSKCDASAPRLCQSKAVPFRENERGKSDNASYLPLIHNSTCLYCNGECKTLENLDKTEMCDGNFIIVNCDLKRDMMNNDTGVCGGAGKYVCYYEDSEPECRCNTTTKLGDQCKADFIVTCKCFNTTLELDCKNKFPECREEKKSDWDNCTVDYIHKDLKCVCSKGANTDENVPDCPEDIPEETNTGAKKHQETNCGSTIQGSIVFIVGVKIIQFYLNIR